MWFNNIMKVVCDTMMAGVLVIASTMITAWMIGMIRRHIGK